MASIQLSIAEPCQEKWNDMLPEEKGRFCLSCQKTVVDFTGMTDGQVFDYFKNYKGTTCGQFAPEQLNRSIAKPATHSIGRWKYFWQILLPAVFAFYKGEAQQLRGKVSPLTFAKPDTAKQISIRMGMVAMSRPSPEYRLRGTVCNEKGEPIPNATLITQSGRQCIADSAGHFSVVLIPGQYLTISSIGYETKTLSYDSILPKLVKNIEVDKKTHTILVAADIPLKQQAAKLGEVVVVGSGTIYCRSVTGSTVTVVSRHSIFSKPVSKAPVSDFPSLKIFPNPIQPGQSFQMNLQLSKIGNYLLRITDVTGKLLIEKKLKVNSQKQTETIDGAALQQAGIYLISVIGSDNRRDKGLSGKVVVR